MWGLLLLFERREVVLGIFIPMPEEIAFKIYRRETIRIPSRVERILSSCAIGGAAAWRRRSIMPKWSTQGICKFISDAYAAEICRPLEVLYEGGMPGKLGTASVASEGHGGRRDKV